MIKKLVSKKIIITTALAFSLFLIYIMPKDRLSVLQDNLPQNLEYVNKDVLTSYIYLLDSHNMLGLTNVVVSSREVEIKAKELIEILIKSGTGENRIPSGFKSILPSDTRLISLQFQEGLIKVNFSKELLDVSAELEEKLVEAIVYTLTNIEGVEKVIIYVEDQILTKLPKTKINLPATLDRSFGINKKYDITSSSGVTGVTVYYINKHNNDYYYVPVTKYSNDSREKVKIIIDELSSNHVYNTNLMSFLNANAELLSAEQTDDVMQLEFNSYIFDNDISKNILEEVIYTIALSINDNYSVKEVVFSVDNEEIHKSVLKTIE